VDILNPKSQTQNPKILILVILLFFVCVLLAVPVVAQEETIEKKFALEVEYGSATFTPLPLTDIGSTLYGQSINGTPFGGNAIFVIAPRVIFGVDYRNFMHTYEKPKDINGTSITQNKVNITQITAFLDLSSFALGSISKNSIAKDVFIEVGPCYTELKEEYVRSDTGQYSFTATGYGLDVRIGYRALTKEPLSFFTRVKITIPLAHDNKKSESGLKLNGAITTSVNMGICFSF